MTPSRIAILAATSATAVVLLAGCQSAAPEPSPATSTPAATSPAAQGSVDPAGTMESGAATDAQAAADHMVGMSAEEAEAYATEVGVEYRVGTVDGQPQAVTMDYRPDRVTVTIDNGVVTAATVG